MTIDTIIFDLDGVLVDTEQIHTDTFNEAARSVLSKDQYPSLNSISHDGRTTRQKLQSLSVLANIDLKQIQEIDSIKQLLVIDRLKDIRPDTDKITLLSELSKKYKIGLASNSRKNNVDTILSSMQISEFFDVILTADNVLIPKPNPEIFIRTMELLETTPEKTLIFEDSPAGLEAAISSLAKTVRVFNSKEICLEKVLDEIRKAEN